MKQKLDINTWDRKEHFNFFNQFEEPFYGVCVNVDCTAAYKFAKANKVSFFVYYLYLALVASNRIVPFKLRIEGEDVFIYDEIDAGSTVGRSNGTFGYGYYKYYPTFEEFNTEAGKEIERVQNRTDLVRSPAANVIRCSALPWIDFTSVSHARMFSVKDSCPRISFGKMTDSNGIKSMPVSIHVHHALVDGLHVGQYIDCFQELMNKGV
ncbi:CatA-like O-acetyltransferase [Mucilaginibacter sp.]|uniref:CatA-like O-acetyltransferase n=1 Tax=Mucilaginibacter sp. TaxID=1882438 RepID=UPI003D12D2EC